MDREELIQKLKEFKLLVSKEMDVEKLILFGSQARGKATKQSDVDLIVVSSFFEDMKCGRGSNLYLSWKIDLPVDFLCYTPEEFAKLKEKISIVREAVKEGILIA